jgi:PAT family beta-lactamase induction signal transducer AmpG
MDASETAPNIAAKPETRLWLFGVLIGPNAVISHSVVGGTLSLLLRREGVGLAQSATIVSLLWLPFVTNFLWGPITDFWMRRRSWILTASIAAALLLVAAFHMRSLASPAAMVLLFLSACCGQLVLAACGGMMGTLGDESARRRAGGFYQGGSLAIGSVGVFVISMLADRMSVPALSWVIALLVMLPALAALAMPLQQEMGRGSFGEELRRIGQEFRRTFLRWEAVPYVLLLCSPMGSGAAIGLLAGLAKDYHVSAHQVAWMNGFASLALTPAGAVIAGRLPVQMKSTLGYSMTAALNAATLIVLWVGPMRPATYFLSTALFLFSIGACYAMYTSVTLDFLGESGKSGSARFALINSAGNVPVTYVDWLDGRGYALWGPRGLPATEAVLGLAASGAWMVYFLLRRKRVSEG